MTETPAPDALAEDLMVPIRSALRFAASHSCITAAQEKAILTALRANETPAPDALTDRATEAIGLLYVHDFITEKMRDHARKRLRARKEQP